MRYAINIFSHRIAYITYPENLNAMTYINKAAEDLTK